MNTQPLSGHTIVVTRAVPQAQPLIAAIKASGGTPIGLPLLELVDALDGGTALRAAVGNLGAQDWLVVLSPNGARRLPHGSPSNSFPGKVAAIAAGTARTLADFGYAVSLIPEVASSAGLLQAFESIDVVGRVLIAQAEHGRTELAEGLRQRGVTVEVVTAYRNVIPEVDASIASQARDASLIVFASPSAVTRYHTHVGGDPVTAVCIGAVTAAEAEAAGFAVTVARTPDVTAIMDALVSVAGHSD